MLPAIFTVLYLLGIAISIWGAKDVARFLDSHREIANPEALDAFKQLARRNMYMALAVLPVFGLGILLGIVLIYRHGVPGFVGVLAANAVLFGAGRYLNKLEKRARSLPTTAESLQKEYRRIGETWIRKALPDF
jgi:hypothetical protein